MFNKVIEGGRIANDLELKQTKTGKNVVNFGLAVDKGYGQDKETDFFDVTAWNKTAEIIVGNKKKGELIIVEGRLENQKYQDRQGNDRKKTVIIADRVTFVPAGKGQGGSQTDASVDDDDDEDIPF